MGKFTRTTKLDICLVDDLWFTCAKVLALARSTEISQQELASNISTARLKWLLRSAPASHQFPFENEVNELNEILFNPKLDIKNKPDFCTSWRDSWIFCKLIVDLYHETDKSIVELWFIVYNSELSKLCADKSSAWSITPANQLLCESFEILGLQKYHDPNKIYT